MTGGTFADPVRLSWQDVHEQAKRIGGGLAAMGVGRGGSVAVLATDVVDVAPLAQAAWLQGVAVTMLQHPTPRTDPTVWLADTVRAIGLVKADVVVVGDQFPAALDQLSAQQLVVCTVESLLAAEPAEFDAETDDADIALRQLTSGSTGVPKAVEISHGNLAASASALRDGLDVDISTDVFVSWLPVSHDMGMIAFLCLSMHLGLELVDHPARRVSQASDRLGRIDQQAPRNHHCRTQLRLLGAHPSFAGSCRSQQHRPVIAPGGGQRGRTDRSPPYRRIHHRRCMLRPEGNRRDARPMGSPKPHWSCPWAHRTTPR